MIYKIYSEQYWRLYFLKLRFIIYNKMVGGVQLWVYFTNCQIINSTYVPPSRMKLFDLLILLWYGIAILQGFFRGHNRVKRFYLLWFYFIQSIFEIVVLLFFFLIGDRHYLNQHSILFSGYRGFKLGLKVLFIFRGFFLVI